MQGITKTRETSTSSPPLIKGGQGGIYKPSSLRLNAEASLYILHLFAHLFDQYLEVDGAAGGFGILRFG